MCSFAFVNETDFLELDIGHCDRLRPAAANTSELDGCTPYVLLYSRASHNKPQRRKALGKINESEKKNAGGWMFNPGSVQKK